MTNNPHENMSFSAGHDIHHKQIWYNITWDSLYPLLTSPYCTMPMHKLKQD